MRIYLAGPLFGMAERHFNELLCAALEEKNHEVFLPQRDAGEGTGLKPEELAPHMVFKGDLHGLLDCNAVMAIMDGADQDSGTAWECGFAHALHKPVVLVRTDFRGSGDDSDLGWGNIMLTQSATVIIRHDPTKHGGYPRDVADRVCEELKDL